MSNTATNRQPCCVLLKFKEFILLCQSRCDSGFILSFLQIQVASTIMLCNAREIAQAKELGIDLDA